VKIVRKKHFSYTPFLIAIIILLLIFVGYLLNSISQLSQYQNTIGNNTANFQHNKANPPQDSITKKSDSLTTFTHPVLRYTIDFPSAWTAKLYTSPAGYTIQPYRDLILYSPGFNPQAVDETNALSGQNALILMRVTKTSYKTIDDKFRNNLTAQEIATNIEKIKVNGVDAIQYDYSVKNESATVVTLVKNNLWYYVTFQYTNQVVRRQYVSVFQEVINSLKLN